MELNKKQIEDGTISPIDVALLYLACGRKDEAFAWLEKNFDNPCSRQLSDLRA
jgi:hypothetical protein